MRQVFKNAPIPAIRATGITGLRESARSVCRASWVNHVQEKQNLIHDEITKRGLAEKDLQDLVWKASGIEISRTRLERIRNVDFAQPRTRKRPTVDDIHLLCWVLGIRVDEQQLKREALQRMLLPRVVETWENQTGSAPRLDFDDASTRQQFRDTMRELDSDLPDIRAFIESSNYAQLTDHLSHRPANVVFYVTHWVPLRAMLDSYESVIRYSAKAARNALGVQTKEGEELEGFIDLLLNLQAAFKASRRDVKLAYNHLWTKKQFTDALFNGASANLSVYKSIQPSALKVMLHEFQLTPTDLFRQNVGTLLLQCSKARRLLSAVLSS